MPKAEDVPNELEIRTVISACREKFSLVNHQLESYDNFVQSILPSIFKENSVLVASYPIEANVKYQRRLEFIFKDVTIGPPSLKEASGFINQIRPSEARIRGAAYVPHRFLSQLNKEPCTYQ